MKPEYKIGDIVLYRDIFGFIQQGVIRAANYLPTINWEGNDDYKWEYYVSSRATSWYVKRKDIISKA